MGVQRLLKINTPHLIPNYSQMPILFPGCFPVFDMLTSQNIEDKVKGFPGNR